MKLEKLIDELDQKFGNKFAPKQYRIIQEAVKELKKYQELLEKGSK